MKLEWSSTRPDYAYALKLMAEVFKWSNLKRISLTVHMAHDAPTGTVSSEEEIEE